MVESPIKSIQFNLILFYVVNVKLRGKVSNSNLIYCFKTYHRQNLFSDVNIPVDCIFNVNVVNIKSILIDKIKSNSEKLCQSCVPVLCFILHF